MENKYNYAIAQLNVSRAHLAITIDKWEKEIEKHGPDEHSCRFHEDAVKKLAEIELAIDALSNPPH